MKASEVKKKLKEHAHTSASDGREVKVFRHHDSFSHKTGSVFFSVKGNPPKGFAVYVPELKVLAFLSSAGVPYDVIKDVEIDFNGVDIRE